MREPRRFTDAHGIEWDVYEGVSAGRPPAVMRPVPSSTFAPARRWLTFESENERRRLEPAPWGWEDAPVTELIRLLNLAVPIFKRPHRPSTGADSES